MHAKEVVPGNFIRDHGTFWYIDIKYWCVKGKVLLKIKVPETTYITFVNSYFIPF